VTRCADDDDDDSIRSNSCIDVIIITSTGKEKSDRMFNKADFETKFLNYL
jgi:hypothetical protein